MGCWASGGAGMTGGGRCAVVAGLTGLYLQVQAGIGEELLGCAVEFGGFVELFGVGDAQVAGQSAWWRDVDGDGPY